MKPHESTLKDEKCASHFSDHDHFLYASDGDEQHVAYIPCDAPGGPEQWVRLFQGAKGMTEALLGLGREGWLGANREWHLGVCWGSIHEPGGECLDGCRDARKALHAAGALP
jgi:hypothetical protein